MIGKGDVANVATKIGRLVNGGVVGYYVGGKTSEVMSSTLPEQIIKVVEFHKKLQLGASLAQSIFPGAGVAAMAAAVASIWKMYYDTNQILGITISENVGKSLTSAVVTNLASFSAKGVATTVSEGAKLIPFVGWVASAAITAASTTAIIYGSAYLYLNALTKMYEVEGQFDLDYLTQTLSDTSNGSKHSGKTANRPYHTSGNSNFTSDNQRELERIRRLSGTTQTTRYKTSRTYHTSNNSNYSRDNQRELERIRKLSKR